MKTLLWFCQDNHRFLLTSLLCRFHRIKHSTKYSTGQQFILVESFGLFLKLYALHHKSPPHQINAIKEQ